MRHPILRPALTAFGSDQLGVHHLELHQLRRDRHDRLGQHVGVLVDEHWEFPGFPDT
jgi:hypothetical protein